jgi:hypothetical protein
MVPPITASIAVLPIISLALLDLPEDPNAVLMNGFIHIRTLGYGQGPYGFFNNLFKNTAWDSVDQKVIDKFK